MSQENLLTATSLPSVTSLLTFVFYIRSKQHLIWSTYTFPSSAIHEPNNNSPPQSSYIQRHYLTMVDKDKNTKAAKDNLPITNDVQYNGMVRALTRLEEKAALRKTAKPHEEAATKAEVDKTSREFISANNEMYGRHGSFPLDSGSDNFTHEQRRAYRKLYAEIEAKIQLIENGGVDESRRFESMPELARAFGVELPEAFKEKKHTDKQEEPKQKGWMPKKYTPVDREYCGCCYMLKTC